jgi:methionyl-tRNA synthetase
LRFGVKMKYLVTSALPYANGPLHFGHLAGVYLPSDCYTRHKRLMGEEIIHICGSDEHGVAIMLNANKEKKSFQEYVDSWHLEHKSLFEQFEIEFDFFGQTSSDYHAEEVVKWFHELNEKGLIGTKDCQQLQCGDCKNLLPDRFVEGECYSCHFETARGDECPKCGILVEPTKLINPVCKICGSKNIDEVTVTQYYLLLSKFYDQWKSWFQNQTHWRKSVYPFVEALTSEGLHDRAISRDLDWGIDVPLASATGKKLYVWFDAPIGYVSNTKQLFKETGQKDDYLKDWWKNDDTSIVQFMAKDNIIFHSIIFPVMGMATDFINPPSDLPANQYLNLAGKQFSKSTGWYVDCFEALKDFGPDALRYYLLSISPENSDSSFVWEHFSDKVNNELANNIGNLVSRCFKFIHKNFPEGLPQTGDSFTSLEVVQELKEIYLEKQESMDKIQLRRSLEKVMKMGQLINNYFSDCAPWAQFKEDPKIAGNTLFITSQLIYVLAQNLRPFLPGMSDKIFKLYSQEDPTEDLSRFIYAGDWGKMDELFSKGLILGEEPQTLVPKIDKKLIEKKTEELKGL